MRFVHIADVHLGAKPDAGPLYSKMRPRELWESFEQVLRVCEEEKTDLLLIAGDLFHRQPLVRELKEADYLFSELTHTKVVLIAGNHDYIGKDSNYRTFSWSDNVYPLFGRKMQCADFPELQTAVYGLSYHEREISRPLYDGIRALGRRRHEILLAHGGDEKHIPFDRRLMEKAGFDYVALGHLHAPQSIGSLHYSGSPLKYSFDECNQRKSVTELTVTGKQARLREIPVTPAHDVRVLTGSLQQLLDAAAYDP